MDDPNEPIDFAAHARRRQARAAAAAEYAERQAEAQAMSPEEETLAVAHAWERAAAEQGVSLLDPAVAAGVTGIALLLERMIYGGMTVRYGDPARGIEANPEDGIDQTSAQCLIGVIRDLRDAPGILRDATGQQ